MMDPGTLLIVVLFLTIAYYIYTKLSRRKYNFPPGPKPWPVIGNLPELVKNKKHFNLFMEYKKEYGNIFTVHLGPDPVVVLASLDMVREGLLQKQNQFAGRSSTFTTHTLTMGKDIAFGQYGPVWKKQRKIAHSAMRKYATGKHLEELVHASFERISKLIDAKAETGEAFDPLHICSLFIYNIISAMTFGKVFEIDDPFFSTMMDLNEDFNENVGDGLLADLWPIFQYLPTQGKQLIVDFRDTIYKYLDNVLREHKDNYNPDEVTDLTYHLLDVLRKTEDEEGTSAVEGITMDHIRGILFDIFFAGTETSSMTILWALLYLANHPGIQQKAQAEIDAVIDDGEVIRTDMKGKLSYTDAMFHEVTRIRTLAPLALPHETLEDVTIGGFNLPKGTTVMPFLHALHIDPEQWPEPEKFKPERFLDEDGNITSRISSWMPFSTGRRVCVGESVAKVELLLSMSYLLKRYTFKLPPGVEKIAPECRDMGTTMEPVPYKLVVVKRSKSDQ